MPELLSPGADRAARRTPVVRAPRRHPFPLGLAAALVALLALSGCGLRIETDPPPPLIPDLAEEARQRTAVDARTIADTARAAAGALGAGPATPADGTDADDDAAAPGPDEGVGRTAAFLGEVADAAEAHVEALGGVYDPGTDDPDGDDGGSALDGDESAEDDPTPSPPPTVDDVVELLRSTAAAARADALTLADGPLARLVGSIAVHRTTAADVLGGPDQGAEDEPAGEGSGEETGDAATDDATEGTGAGTPDPAALVPVVLAEDAAGQAWELAAARSADEARLRAADRAAAHRATASAWVRDAGLTGPDDPRLADYAMPDGLDAAETRAAALAALERDLADRYLALLAVPGAGDGGRGRLLDAAADATAVAYRLDALLPVLPGMPEQQR